jgi:hypothetical protein
MLSLAIQAAQDTNTRKIVWVAGISAIVGVVVFLYGFSRGGKSEMSGTIAFAGGSLAVVGALVAAYVGR